MSLANLNSQFQEHYWLSIKLADWIQIGILLAAFLAILTPQLIVWYRRSKEEETLRAALLQELLANMDSLFNGGIERPFIYGVFETILSSPGAKLKDSNAESKFQEIVSLYIELKDFREITDRYWPPSRSGYMVESEVLCTRKQVETINAFLRYFGEEEVILSDKKLAILKASRESAQLLRNTKQADWHSTLKLNISDII